MALTDWIQTAAVIYFAWQQNRIFKQQNQIFADQAGRSAMSKTSQIPWITRYWPTTVMVGLAVLTGYDIYARRGASPVIPWWFYALLLLIVIAIGLIASARSAPRTEKLKELSKLVIHRATWGAAKGPGPRVDVTDKLAALERDGLMVDIKHQNPILGDPCPGKPKRLDVEYSYGSEINHAQMSRWEGNLSAIPEDTHAKWLWSELQKAKEENKSKFPLTELQNDAIRLSLELLDFLKEIGPPPVPKYTAEQINDMNSAQMKVLINAQDGDFFDACEYYFGDKHHFGQTAQGVQNELIVRSTRMLTWYRKFQAAYDLQGLKGKVEALRNRFTVEGVEADALIAPIPYKDSAQHIRSVAAKLWELAFEIGAKGNT
jgi:hypothetical protein